MEYDPKVATFASLLDHAARRDCAIKVFTRTDSQQMSATAVVGKRAVRTDERIKGVADNKYYLARGALKFLPMTPSQAARVNAGVGNAKSWLSARQLVLLARIEKEPDAGWPVAVHVEFRKAWVLASEHRVGAVRKP